ncbi:MAG TPA: cation:proton antiporter [Candidatus Dormibacteraeota bacterium]|nr:cation:proton antiporter [Candidatus Dormibacteraeota bacterium]
MLATTLGILAHNTYAVAAGWMLLALGASIISIRVGISVALLEMTMGVVAGNLFHLPNGSDWLTFLAGFGSVLLTFLAGAEIDPDSLRRQWKAALAIGFVSFAVPFASIWLMCLHLLHWSMQGAEIGGTALSTTSVAVVYAVMVETGLNRTQLGKLILAACFVTDMGTVLALGALFANYNAVLLVFVATLLVVAFLLPRGLRWFIRKVGRSVSEPEIKLLFVLLFGLGALAQLAKSEAVLPAYVLGITAAVIFHHDRQLTERLRSTAFALLTPFFFLRAGSLLSVAAIVPSLGVVALLFVAKMVTKIVGVYPVARLAGLRGRSAPYATLMMATGLTFGSISALYGLTHGYIDKAQYSWLLTAVIGSALLPTLLAQAAFSPGAIKLHLRGDQREEGAFDQDLDLDEEQERFERMEQLPGTENA